MAFIWSIGPKFCEIILIVSWYTLYQFQLDTISSFGVIGTLVLKNHWFHVRETIFRLYVIDFGVFFEPGLAIFGRSPIKLYIFWKGIWSYVW